MDMDIIDTAEWRGDMCMMCCVARQQTRLFKAQTMLVTFRFECPRHFFKVKHRVKGRFFHFLFSRRARSTGVPPCPACQLGSRVINHH